MQYLKSKFTHMLKEDEEPEEDKEIIVNSDDEEVVWFWRSDSSKNDQQDILVPYSLDFSKTLEKAYIAAKASTSKKIPKVPVDDERYVDISETPYFQRRYDDPDRCRMVQREIGVFVSFSFFKKPLRINVLLEGVIHCLTIQNIRKLVSLTPSTVVSSSTAAPPALPAPKKKAVEEEEEDDESDDDEEIDDADLVNWYWADDGPKGSQVS